MILVECLECDAEIWDNADKCHHCGTPNCSVSDRKLIEDLDKSVDNILQNSLILILLAIILIAVLVFG